MPQREDKRAAPLLIDLQRGIVANYLQSDFLPRIQHATQAALLSGSRNMPLKQWMTEKINAGIPEA